MQVYVLEIINIWLFQDIISRLSVVYKGFKIISCLISITRYTHFPRKTLTSILSTQRNISASHRIVFQIHDGKQFTSDYIWFHAINSKLFSLLSRFHSRIYMFGIEIWMINAHLKYEISFMNVYNVALFRWEMLDWHVIKWTITTKTRSKDLNR